MTSEQKFIDKILPLCEEWSNVLHPAATAAHACVASSFGADVITKASNNLFMIKTPEGEHSRESYVSRSTQLRGGTVVNVIEVYKKFGSFEESIRDYALMIDRHFEQATLWRAHPVAFLCALFLVKSGRRWRAFGGKTKDQAFQEIMDVLTEYKLYSDQPPPMTYSRVAILKLRLPLLERLQSALTGRLIGPLKVVGPRLSSGGGNQFDVLK